MKSMLMLAFMAAMTMWLASCGKSDKDVVGTAAPAKVKAAAESAAGSGAKVESMPAMQGSGTKDEGSGTK